MKIKIKKLLAFALALLALFTSACSTGTTGLTYDTIPESTGGKDVERAAAADNVFSLNSNPERSFNPLIATNHSNQLVCALVYQNMVELDNNFEVIPNVIIDWEHSEDCKSWILTMDTGHTFHDGTPVTGRDLRYSLERAVNADRYRGRFASFLGASYTDDKLYVTLGIGDAQFVKLLNIPIIQYGTHGDDYPGGSGPYMYNEDHTQLIPYTGYIGRPIMDEPTEEEEEAGEGLLVTEEEANSIGPEVRHSPVKHPVDVIFLKAYPDATSILSAYEDSLIDVVINDPSSYTNLGYASTNEIHTYPTTNMHYVVFNEASVLGRYANFRYAMNFAFDRSALVGLLHGNGVASAVPMYPTCPDYPNDINNNLGYDLDMCKRVLENAGVQDYDSDGMLEYMSGSPQEIDLQFIVCSDSSAKTGIVRRYADDMASIGLKVTVRELSWDDYMTALEEGDYDLYYGEVKLRSNFDLTELLQVRPELDEGEKTTNINFSNSADISYELYIQSYLAAGDIDRAAQYRNLVDYVSQNAMLITIGFEKQQIICHRGIVKGINANLGNPLFDFTEWEFVEPYDSVDVNAPKPTPTPAAEEGAEGEEQGEAPPEE